MMQYTNNRSYAVLTTRFWGATTVLLCALLSQNCQSQLNAIEEESPAAAPLQSGCQPPASEALTQPLGYPPSLMTATHQPKVPLKAFAGISPSAGIRPTASTTRSRNLLTQDSAPVFTTASGEHVKFSQIDGQWIATLQADSGVSTLQRTLPVVGPANIGSFLSWLHRQDIWTSRAHIHVLDTSQYSPCVYLGKAGLSRSMASGSLPGKQISASLLVHVFTWVRQVYGEVCLVMRRKTQSHVPDDNPQAQMLSWLSVIRRHVMGRGRSQSIFAGKP